MTITTTTRHKQLAAYCQYGPSYQRDVAEALADARLFAERGNTDTAEHYLLVAEARAGAITFDELEARDPTGPTWVGVRSGIPSWGGDATSTVAQRDRIRAAMLASGFAWPLARIEIRRSAGASSDLPIAIGLLAATGVMPPTTPRPRGTLRLDSSISDTEHPIGAGTLRELVEIYRARS